MGLASINERDSELIEVLEAAQACLFLFFLGSDEQVVSSISRSSMVLAEGESHLALLAAPSLRVER